MNIQLLCITIGFFTSILFSGSIIWWLIFKNIKKKNKIEYLYNLIYKYKEKNIHLEYFKIQYKICEQELKLQKQNNYNQALKLSELTTKLEETKLTSKEKQTLLINSEQRLNIQFENLANRIFEHNEDRFLKHNCNTLTSLLSPFREQLDNFCKQMHENFSKDNCKQNTLSYEINQLQKLNLYMAKETYKLTKALKGNNKIQGCWGEVILTRILESSGLRLGHEFEIQVSMNHEHRRYQPDVIIHLPKGRDIIVDSKMSLISYERYFNSENEEEKIKQLKLYLTSIRTHIKDLGKKDYFTLNNVKSLDYILMFIALEPAYLVALREAPELIEESLNNNILLVCPSTLLIAVRTINNFWCFERQNKNTEIIVERASKMYNKMRLLINEIHDLGQNLNSIQLNYQSIIKKLSEGKGNLISQAKILKELGIKIKQPIDSKFINNSN